MSNGNQIIETVVNKVTTLNPEVEITSASEEEIAKLKKLFPQTPELLLQLLKQCNGTIGASFFPDSLELLTCESIIDISEDDDPANQIVDDAENLVNEGVVFIDKAIKPIFFNKKHLAFASCNGDSFLLIDFDPAPTGRMGQIVYQDAESCILKVIAPSFEDLLKQYCADLENDLFIYDEDYCSILLASGEDWIEL